MSARTVFVGAATVLGVGAVLVLNPADAKSRGEGPSSVEQSSVTSDSFPAGSQLPPTQPVGEQSHDFTTEWTERDGWHGTWDDDFRGDDRGHRPPPADRPPSVDQIPVEPAPHGGYTISGGGDDDWFEYDDHEGESGSDDDGDDEREGDD
mgnify:CR=1 FL=1